MVARDGMLCIACCFLKNSYVALQWDGIKRKSSWEVLRVWWDHEGRANVKKPMRESQSYVKETMSLSECRFQLPQSYCQYCFWDLAMWLRSYFFFFLSFLGFSLLCLNLTYNISWIRGRAKKWDFFSPD